MATYERDYLLRTIRQIAEVIGRLMKLAKPQPEEAQRLLIQSGQKLFGPLYSTLSRCDATTITSLLNEPEKRWALAMLLAEEEALLALRGDVARAERRHRVAEDLLRGLQEAPGGLGQEALQMLHQRLLNSGSEDKFHTPDA